MLEKPAEYNEVPAQQGETTVYAEDINQIITNVEKLKGGEADETPASNIKDLDARLKTLEGGSSSVITDAGDISFDNTNADLDFSSQYDFPQIKNELKKSYTITLCEYNAEYIETAEKYYLTLELQENSGYVLKGSLNILKQNSVCDFIIAELDDGQNKSKDFGYILNVLYQLLPFKNTPFKDGEIQAQTDTAGLKYMLGNIFGVNIFRIQTADDDSYRAPTDNFNITLNIAIPNSNIKNNNQYIPVLYSGSLGLEYLKIETQNGKALINGSISKYASYSFVLFSYEALEYYFDVKSDINEAHYTNGGDGLKAKNSKQVQYYIRKETIDMGDISDAYIGYSCTCYYLEIKYADGSSISSGDGFIFNLTAPKNAEVSKIEKPHTIQNVIEILVQEIRELKGTNVTTEETYSFEKTQITLNNEESELQINSDCFGDLSQIKLIKKSDGSLYLLGTIELISSAQTAAIRVSKTLNIDARKLVGLITNQTTGTQYFSVYQDNYLYICFIAGKNQEANINISSDKIYDPNIICPIDINFALLAGYNVSEDFGIHLIGGKYILKGSITPTGNTASFYVNCSIEDFFENGKDYEYAGYTIQAVSLRPLYSGIIINGLTANKENTIYFECPKQPAI